jgi:large subunit ribosomal protein L2
MALKTFRPLTPTSRFKALPAFDEVTASKPQKSLLVTRKKTGGRNNHGRITCRHIGGGNKQRYRLVDFKRKKHDVVAEVLSVEYDPIRSARIALLQYTDGERAYILAPIGLEVGMKVSSGPNAEPKVGNALPLSKLPLGASLHCVELVPGKGGQLARSAGQMVILSNREAGYALLKLPSGEIRRVHESCYATFGQVGNVDHMNVSSGKAGRSRWRGVRPTVRGMVMNPVDHPNGGGQGKSKGGGGRQHLCSPWGQLAKGFKTRRKHNTSDRFILERRKGNK